VDSLADCEQKGRTDSRMTAPLSSNRLCMLRTRTGLTSHVLRNLYITLNSYARLSSQHCRVFCPEHADVLSSPVLSWTTNRRW